MNHNNSSLNSGSAAAELHFMKDGRGKLMKIFEGKTGHEYDAFFERLVDYCHSGRLG